MILYLDSKKLCKFLSDKNPDEYYFVLISENILSDGKYDNVSTMSILLPSPTTLRKFYNDGLTDEYVSEYLRYISTNVEALTNLAIIVKAAIKDDKNLILVNTPSENASSYMKIIADYIENAFKLKVFSYKQYKNDPKEAFRKYTVEEKKIAFERLKAVCKHLSDKGENIDIIIHPEFFIRKLAKLKKKELRKYCEMKNIALYGDERKDKEAMIEKIMRRVAIL